MALQAVAESWKRFVLPTQGFPWCLFRILDCDSPEALCLKIQEMQSSLAACPKCVDLEFSTPILKFLSGSGSSNHDSDHMVSVKNFLDDIATHAPLSSDRVECRHGLCQHLLHRWRGVKPTDEVAAESVAWQLISRSYGKFRSFMWELYGSKCTAMRLAKFGNAACNQYTKPGSSLKSQGECRSGKMSFEKLDRLLAFEQEGSIRMPRKLCGLPAGSSALHVRLWVSCHAPSRPSLIP